MVFSASILHRAVCIQHFTMTTHVGTKALILVAFISAMYRSTRALSANNLLTLVQYEMEKEKEKG